MLFFFLIAVISSMYHVCYSKLPEVAFCFLHNAYYHRFLDTMTASLMIMVMFVYLNPVIRVPCTKKYVSEYDHETCREHKIQVRNRDYPALYVVIIVFGMFLWMAIQLRVGFDNNYFSPSLAMIALSTYLGLVLVITVSLYYRKHPHMTRLLYSKFKSRFHIKWTLVSVGLMAISLVIMAVAQLKQQRYYRYCHFVWHLTTAFSAYIFIGSLRCGEDEECKEEFYK